MSAKSPLAAALAGLLFAVGLCVSGMADPAKVIAFLDVAGSWDPSLMLVMGGAIGTHALLRRLILRRRAPVLAETFSEPSAKRIDAPLVVGAALFGIGWGLSGWCPGPAFTSLGAGGRTLAVFVLSMGGGMLLFRGWTALRSRSTSGTDRATA